MSTQAKSNPSLIALRAAVEEALPGRRHPGRIQLDDGNEFDTPNLSIPRAIFTPTSSTPLAAD